MSLRLTSRGLLPLLLASSLCFVACDSETGSSRTNLTGTGGDGAGTGATSGSSGSAGENGQAGLGGGGSSGVAGSGGTGAQSGDAGSGGTSGVGGAGEGGTGSSGSSGTGSGGMGGQGAAGTGGTGSSGTSGASGASGAAGENGTAGAAGEGEPCTVNGVEGTCLDVSDCTGANHATPGFCPGASNIQCCTPSTAGECDPDAMVLPNEGLVEAPGVGGCPSGMAPVSTFCVDRWEASLVLVAGGSWSPYFNPGSEMVRAVSIEGAVPQGYIDQVRASAACDASGKRLCSNTEWLRACEGASGTTYPYGNADEPGVCNDARAVHPAVEYYGTSDPWIYSHLDNACINQLESSLDTTGSNTGCVSEDGLFDMMGNLHEWTADPAGTFRGGYYVDTVENGPGCHYATTAHNTSYWDYSTGFRCCADL